MELGRDTANLLLRPVTNAIAQNAIGDEIEPQPRDVRLVRQQAFGQIRCRIFISRQVIVVAGAEKLLAFKGQLKKAHVVNAFSSPEDLAAKVTQDVVRLVGAMDRAPGAQVLPQLGRRLPMRLDPKTPDRLIHAVRRFERIEQRFTEFRQALDWFKSPQCPLRQVTVEQGEDARCVIASFGTTRVVLRLHLTLPDDGVAAGQVICTRSQAQLGNADALVASFMFDAQGRTSFEVGADGDPVEMGQHAVEILLHVLQAATRPVDPEISPFGGATGSQNAKARL